VDLVSAFINERLVLVGLRDPIIPVQLRPKLVTTGLIVRQYFMNARLSTSFCSYNSACTNIFVHGSRRCDHNE